MVLFHCATLGGSREQHMTVLNRNTLHFTATSPHLYMQSKSSLSVKHYLVVITRMKQLP